MSVSYGHTYLTSYGWAGSGTGLRKGAIDKPLAIPPKKNLSGLGKDRDDAFPFWDHLFTAASKAIKIKLSSDDEDSGDIEDPSLHTDPGSIPLRRTMTGIISNQRPTLGTPASTSGDTTPNVIGNTDTDVPGALSLLATAKREAAKRGLYSRFFRGPVLGPDSADTTSSPTPSSSQSSSGSMSVSEQAGEPKKSKKRKPDDKTETKEERRERKRLKKERKAARAGKKVKKALTREKAKADKLDRKARKRQEKETRSQENEGTPCPGKGHEQARESVADPEDPEAEKFTRKEGRQDTLHRPPDSVDATGALDIPCKMRKKKRKDTPP